MEEENVNDFTQSPIPTTGAPSFSQNILPGLFGGFQTIGEGMAQKYEREAEEDKKKEEKLKKQNAAWMEQLYNMPLAYEKDMAQIRGQVDTYNNWILTKMKEGEDMDNLSTDDILKKKEMEFELAKATAITKDNQTYLDNLRSVIKKDQDEGTYKYNAEEAAKFIVDYETAPTLEARMKLRAEKNPLKLNLELDDFVDETIPPNETETTTAIYRDPVYHKQIVLDKIRNTPGGREYYDNLKQANETEEQFADRVVKQGQLRYPRKPKSLPRSSQGSTTKSSDSAGGYGTGTWGGLIVSKGPNKSSMFDQSIVNNTITVKRKGTNADLPPVFVTHMGQDIKFQPISYHMGPNNRIIVYGNGINDDDTVVKGVYVDYDEGNNATTFTSQLENMDIRQEFAAQPGAGVMSGGTLNAPSIDPN